MGNGYESLIGRVKEDLRGMTNITEDDIKESVQYESIRCKKRYNLSDRTVLQMHS